jgi:hypothetical protein
MKDGYQAGSGPEPVKLGATSWFFRSSTDLVKMTEANNLPPVNGSSQIL